MIYNNQKILIRVLEKSDLKILQEYRYSPEIRPFYHGIEDPSLSQQEDWFYTLQKDTTKRYYVCQDIKSNKIYSVLNFSGLNLKDRNANVGWYFISSNICSTNSVIIFLHYLFFEIGLIRVYSDVMSYNIKALEFNQKIGFLDEGTLRNHVYKYEKYHDVKLVGMLKKDFFNKNKKIIDRLELGSQHSLNTQTNKI